MTDKEQIIIDGVDVSECNFFNNITENHYCLGIPCKDRPYCYFKQLARKTQECEELEERLERTEEDLKYQCADCMNIKSDRYLKALEEIEEIVKGMRSVFIEEISITASQLNDRIYQETTARFRQILDIINKTKGK